MNRITCRLKTNHGPTDFVWYDRPVKCACGRYVTKPINYRWDGVSGTGMWETKKVRSTPQSNPAL